MGSAKKRGQPRFKIDGTFDGSELVAFHARQKAAVFRGKVQNISDGGFCLFANHAPKESILLHGQLKLARLPSHIPILVQVRWVDRLPGSRNYRIGVRYVV